MDKKVVVYDPTATDEQNKTRGVGRYLQILKETFPEFTFTNKVTNQLSNEAAVFINPFIKFFSPPVITKRIAHKQIAVIHDLIPLKYPGHFPAGIKGKINFLRNQFAMNNYDQIITVSEASKKNIAEILNIDENKIKVIYHCLPKIYRNYELKVINDEYVNSSFLTHNSKFLLYVGDATWNKNLVNLAKAIKIVDIPCVFVGKVFSKVADSVARDTSLLRGSSEYLGNPLLEESPHSRHLPLKSTETAPINLTNPWQQELKEFLEITKDDKRFIFPGYVPDEELIRLYQKAKLNILVSRDEGFGFSFVEAASQKCPSVLSNIPVFKETALETAFFANPENVNDIADKIKEIYFNNEIRNKLAEKAYERSRFFSQEKFKTEWKKVIEF